MPKLEGDFLHIEVEWATMLALLNGSTATLGYIETDIGGDPEILAIDDKVAYRHVVSTDNAAAWTALKVTATAYRGVSVVDDVGVRRLEINGKVVVVGAVPPPATNPVIIDASSPLLVGLHDTIFTIPDGETFHLQSMFAGNADPTKGASVEVIFDANGVEHLVIRAYTAGATVGNSFADISTARDGTAMVGNPGGTNVVIVRREKFSGSNIAIDAVVRGYTV